MNDKKTFFDNPEDRVADSLLTWSVILQKAAGIVSSLAKEADAKWYQAILDQDGSLYDHYSRQLAKEMLEDCARQADRRASDWSWARMIIQKERKRYQEQRIAGLEQEKAEIDDIVPPKTFCPDWAEHTPHPGDLDTEPPEDPEDDDYPPGMDKVARGWYEEAKRAHQNAAYWHNRFEELEAQKEAEPAPHLSSDEGLDLRRKAQKDLEEL